MQLSCVKLYRNTVALLLQMRFFHEFFVKPPMPLHRSTSASSSGSASILSWPAWKRVLLVLPAITLLWLAVAWANAEIAPW